MVFKIYLCVASFMSDSKEEFFMKGNNKNAMSTGTLVMYALLTAVVIILQFLGAFIHFGPFSVTLVLLPIVIGAALCGPKAGAWLGFVFGAVVLLSGDANAFLSVNVVGTIITVLLKGILAGFLTGIVYNALASKNRFVATAVSAIVCPVVNTGIFLIGCFIFFMDTITVWAAGSESVASYMIFVLVGGNFLFEVAANVILCPVIVRLLNIRQN